MKFTDRLFYKYLPYVSLEALEKYFRVELEGLENLPDRGPAILVPNHSGYLGLDALILSHAVFKARGRIPRIMLHKFWFSKGLLQAPARKFGFLKASLRIGVAALRKKQYLILFPEGERGNFKPSYKMYKLQDFQAGFVRMAAASGAPVIPVLIIGAEESNLTLGQIRMGHLLLPLPLNLFPFPAKWKIRFLPPVHVELKSQAASHEAEHKIASDFQRIMQSELDREIANRKRGVLLHFPVSGRSHRMAG